MESSSMKKLSEELLFYEILPRLPTKSLIRFKSVSKIWLSRISHDSLLAAKHTAGEEAGTIIIHGRYETDEEVIERLFFLDHNESNLVEIDTSYLWEKQPNPTPTFIDMIGSCNGLVCLQLEYFNETEALVLWNPATREVSYLPAAAVRPGGDEMSAGYALGFDAQTGDHKVVRLQIDEEDGFVKANTQIFSKKSGSWRDLKPLTGISPKYNQYRGWTIDGAIYWRTFARLSILNPSKVLSFDLSKEEFREFDGPPLDGHMDLDYLSLCFIKWKGSLGVIALELNGTECQFWLKNNSDSDWKKILTSDPSLGRPSSMSVFRDHIILTCDIHGKNHLLYDIVTNEKRELGALGKLSYPRIFFHFHTFISPN